MFKKELKRLGILSLTKNNLPWLKIATDESRFIKLGQKTYEQKVSIVDSEIEIYFGETNHKNVPHGRGIKKYSD